MCRRDVVKRVLGQAALAAGLAWAGCDRPAAPGPARSGAEIYARCQLCHSTREMQRGPILDGLPAWYVEGQLKKFAEGVRGRNPENRSEALMGAGEAVVHDAGERARVAQYIASLPPQRHLLTVRGDTVRGRVLYQMACAVCHGPTGREGRADLKSPPLTPLEDWYQLDQLRKYQSGLRGTNAADAEGQLMRAVVLSLSEQDFRDVTRYIAEELAATNAPATGPN
jgi:cytochrome c553